MLEPLAFLRPARMRRQERRKPLEHGKIARRDAGFLQHAMGVFAQEQDGGGFRGLIGVLPDPGAVLIARLKRGGHRLAQQMRVERLAAFK